ncbi:MAG: hypothetical protein OXK76_06235 [Gammaproteobacteria bacterium]|nr:hypothetical protein [Gammaproteobacteria bacterium]
MQALEVVAVIGIAAVLATAGYRVANERRDAARVSADLSAVAALAAAYQGAGANCGRPSGTVIGVGDMIAALGGGPSGPAEPAAWGVRYYSRPSSIPSGWPPRGSPRVTGFAFDVVREPGATAAERAALAGLGGRPEGERTVVPWRLGRGATHEGRRVFAAGRAFTGC